MPFVALTDSPAPRRGFIRIEQEDASGFSPVEELEQPSLLKTIALENPATAIGETALNLGTMGVALPIAGLAGIGAAAGKALGLTDADPADVVHKIGETLTYQPRGEFGKATTAAVMTPFEKLAEVGQGAGNRVLDATGSPVLATAVDTAINAAPMAIGPGIKGVKALKERGASKPAEGTVESVIPGESRNAGVDAAEVGYTHADIEPPIPVVRSGFVPLTESVPEVVARTTVTQMVESPEMVQKRAADTAFESVAQAATVDEAIALASRSIDTPLVEAKPVAVEVPVEIPPGRFSRPSYTDDLLGRLERIASPGPKREIQAELQRRTLLAGRVAEEHWAATVQEESIARQQMEARTIEPMAAERMAIPDEALPPDALPNVARGHVLEESVQPASGPLSVQRNASGNLIISGNAADVRAIEATLREELRAQGVPLSKIIDHDDGVSFRAPRDTEPATVLSAVDRANQQVIAGEAVSVGGRRLVPPLSDISMVEPPKRGFVPLEESRQDMAAPVQNGQWAPGANYTAFVDQVRQPVSNSKTVADLPDPIRREQIVSDLAKALDTTIYEGRVKGKNRLGFFRPGVEEVRIKNAADIEVAAHEVAHLIDHRMPEIQRAYLNDKVLRDELKSVSYDQKSVKEGFAEAVRLWTTQPETLEAKAPLAHAWLEDLANTHKYGPALRTAQEQMTGWFGQDALNRARSKIGTDKPLAEYFDRFWKGFRQSTVDDLDGIYRMERELTGKISPNGPYESARTSRASASIADGTVRFGYPVKNRDGSFKFAGKGLEEILQPVSKSLDDALLYFVGRSAEELRMQGREHLFTKGEIDAMLKLKTPERVQAFKDYQAWNKGILDFAEAQGVINPETRKLWKRTQYLPFHRVEQPGGLKGKPGDWAGVQALTGGTTNIKDVLGNMIGNAAMLLDKAVKNEARLKVARLSQMAGGGKFMVKIDTESRPVKIAGDQVLNAMFEKYGIAIDGDAPAFFEFLIRGQPPAGKSVVAVLQQGKPVWFEVGDPILYRALSAIDRPVQSEVVRWLGLPKRIGQATITATPDFWMANIARDTLMGAVMSRAGFRPILDSLQGMKLRLTNDPLYKDYLANGGGLSSIFLDEHHFRTKLEKFYRDQGIDYKTVLDTPDKVLTFVETLGDAFEMSTRLGEYKRAVERGENPRHAAYLGREVSTDFAMRGDSKALGFMYDTVMFLKPALVSWDRLYRGLSHDSNKGAIAVKAGTMALLSAGLYLLNKDDPRYKDLPDWDRDANWHFFLGDQHFRWPKIWEIGALASTAERSVEKIMANDPQGFGKDFARIIRATFSLNAMPQIASPLYEQATNKNNFTKAPIETPGMENVQPFLRSKPGTSETLKAAGMATRDMPESLQINPARTEALLRGYFNTYALYGLMLSDKAFFGDKLPERRTDELPVVRRFYSQEPPKHTKYETEFYDLLTEAKRLQGTMKHLDQMRLQEYADVKEREPLAGEAKPLERAQKHLSVINRDMEQVRSDLSLTPAEKRQKLDELTIERNALLKDTVTDAQQAQKLKEQGGMQK